MNIEEYFKMLGKGYIGIEYIFPVTCVSCTKTFDYSVVIPIEREAHVDEPRLAAELEHELESQMNELRTQHEPEHQYKWFTYGGPEDGESPQIAHCPECDGIHFLVPNEDVESHWIDVFEDDNEEVDENILVVL